MNDVLNDNKLVKNETFGFEDIYVRYYDLMLKYVCKKIDNSEIAEDLTGEIFYKALKNYSKYNPKLASVKTWLFKIAENHLKNYYRDRKITYDIDEHTNEKNVAEDDIMAQAAFLQECRNILAEALKDMPERNRRIIILKYFYNKTSAEIAADLNITEGNVRILTMRTLQKLAKYFESRGIKAEDYI